MISVLASQYLGEVLSESECLSEIPFACVGVARSAHRKVVLIPLRRSITFNRSVWVATPARMLIGTTEECAPPVIESRATRKHSMLDGRFASHDRKKNILDFCKTPGGNPKGRISLPKDAVVRGVYGLQLFVVVSPAVRPAGS